MNIQRLWSVMQGYTDGLSTAEVLRMPPSIPKLLYYVGWLLKVVHTGWYTVSRNPSSDSRAAALISFLFQSAKRCSNPAYCMSSSHEVTLSHLWLQPDQGWMQYVVFKLGGGEKKNKRANKQKNAKVIAAPSGPLVMIIWEIRILKSKYIH